MHILNGIVQAGCPFCDRWMAGKYDSMSKPIPGLPDVMNFVPLRPVTAGHRLFVPLGHIEHKEPMGGMATAAAMMAAQGYGRMTGLDFNLITSYGEHSTQTVKHVHIHFVPRRKNDGLHLPWTGQKEG